MMDYIVWKWPYNLVEKPGKDHVFKRISICVKYFTEDILSCFLDCIFSLGQPLDIMDREWAWTEKSFHTVELEHITQFVSECAFWGLIFLMHMMQNAIMYNSSSHPPKMRKLFPIYQAISYLSKWWWEQTDSCFIRIKSILLEFSFLCKAYWVREEIGSQICRQVDTLKGMHTGIFMIVTTFDF